MYPDEHLARITTDPNVMVGQPCIRGMRITVCLILELLAGRTTVDELLAEYRVLEPEDIRAALVYGSERAREARNCGGMVDGITCDPNILVGKPCVEGTRISVELILHDLAFSSEEEFIEGFDYITPKDIRAAFLLASKLCE